MLTMSKISLGVYIEISTFRYVLSFWLGMPIHKELLVQDFSSYLNAASSASFQVVAADMAEWSGRVLRKQINWARRESEVDVVNREIHAEACIT
jgi:hypothetical protein